MRSHILLAGLVLAVTARAAAAGPAPDDDRPSAGARWSLTLAGGALVPVGLMRDGYQDALDAGVRVGVRGRVGLGVELAVDYSPLPRHEAVTTSTDTSYGTVAVMPAWTLGDGPVRVQLAGGGGVALEQTQTTTADTMTRDRAAVLAALGQLGMYVHVTSGGGLVVLAGATRTFGARDYQYGWAMGGLSLEF